MSSEMVPKSQERRFVSPMDVFLKHVSIVAGMSLIAIAGVAQGEAEAERRGLSPSPVLAVAVIVGAVTTAAFAAEANMRAVLCGQVAGITTGIVTTLITNSYPACTVIGSVVIASLFTGTSAMIASLRFRTF